MDYPSDWERTASTREGVTFHIRPIRASDETPDRDFIVGLSPESRYRRMMNAMLQPPAELLYRFVHVDYHRDIAFAALSGARDGEQIIGIARDAHDRTVANCKFAVAVADAWQNRGVGTALIQLLLEYAHRHGIRKVHGEILTDNPRMLELARGLGMKLTYLPNGAGIVEATREA